MAASLGLARARLGPAAALIAPLQGLAACEENRLTRAREAPTSGPPDLAIAELSAYLGNPEVDAIGVVKDGDQPDWWRMEPSRAMAAAQLREVPVDAHRAHAEYAFTSSGFESALVIVCDASAPSGYTVWEYGSDAGSPKSGGEGGAGAFPIARTYSALTDALGFRSARDEHLVEAMARAGRSGPALQDGIDLTPEGMIVREDLAGLVAAACSRQPDADAARRDIAATIQQTLGSALTELLSRLARTSRSRNLCLSGGLFFNTHFTTTAAHAGLFEQVYIPPHPGRSGSALGAALAVTEGPLAPSMAGAVGSPYLGPGYGDPQIKEALENCKLAFDLPREDRVLEIVLHALSRGRLVGWFNGRLEWGPRALGHRTVLADPFSAHVLENLNGYLKKRPSYRSYGVSVPCSRLAEFFEVPSSMAPGGHVRAPAPSPFMQYEYRPRDLERFRTILPAGVDTLRVHTVDETEPRYLRLLEQWGDMAGTPVLVNTSFNGFHEPLVCSPRDAIRVFYGTGLDLLALEDFILRK